MASSSFKPPSFEIDEMVATVLFFLFGDDRGLSEASEIMIRSPLLASKTFSLS